MNILKYHCCAHVVCVAESLNVGIGSTDVSWQLWAVCVQATVLAHAHAINAGPIFSCVGPSPPERSEERRKNGARTGQYLSLFCCPSYKFYSQTKQRVLAVGVMPIQSSWTCLQNYESWLVCSFVSRHSAYGERILIRSFWKICPACNIPPVLRYHSNSDFGRHLGMACLILIRSFWKICPACSSMPFNFRLWWSRPQVHFESRQYEIWWRVKFLDASLYKCLHFMLPAGDMGLAHLQRKTDCKASFVKEWVFKKNKFLDVFPSEDSFRRCFRLRGKWSCVNLFDQIRAKLFFLVQQKAI